MNLIDKKHSQQIFIEADLKLGSLGELKRLLKEIQKRYDELSEQDENDINVYELRCIYDLMSGYLETYVELVLFKDIIGRYRPNIRMNSLDRMNDFEADKLDKLIYLYGQTSRKGSRHSQPVGIQTPEYSELKEHFEVLLTNFKYN